MHTPSTNTTQLLNDLEDALAELQEALHAHQQKNDETTEENALAEELTRIKDINDRLKETLMLTERKVAYAMDQIEEILETEHGTS